MRAVFFLVLTFFAFFGTPFSITYPNGQSIDFAHMTADFGAKIHGFNVSGLLALDYTLLCDVKSHDPAKYMQKVVVVQRGVCTFATKATNAQLLGAVGLVVGNNDFNQPDSILRMGHVDKLDVFIPTVMISTKSHELVQQIVLAYMSEADSLIGKLDDSTEYPQYPGSPTPSITKGVAPAPTGSYVPPYLPPTEPTDPNMPPPASTSRGVFSPVMILLAVAFAIQLLALVLVCRAKCLQRRRQVAQAQVAAAASVPLTEGVMEEEGEGEGVVEGSGGAHQPLVIRSSALAAYPSMQYSPIMPQASAPSDAYTVVDLQRDVVVIRG